MDNVALKVSTHARPPLRLNGILATPARLSASTIKAPSHMLVPCLGSSLSSTARPEPLSARLQALLQTLLSSWQVPDITRSQEHTRRHRGCDLHILLWLFVCLAHQTVNPRGQEPRMVRLATGEQLNGKMICPLSSNTLNFPEKWVTPEMEKQSHPTLY